MAERAGFEPAIRGYRILEFQSSAFDHSATSPGARRVPQQYGGFNRGPRSEHVGDVFADDQPVVAVAGDG